QRLVNAGPRLLFAVGHGSAPLPGGAGGGLGNGHRVGGQLAAVLVAGGDGVRAVVLVGVPVRTSALHDLAGVVAPGDGDVAVGGVIERERDRVAGVGIDSLRLVSGVDGHVAGGGLAAVL